MFCTSGKEMGAPTGNGMHDSARELTEMASTQFAFYGLMNPYTYQRPKITLLPNETGLTVPGGTGVAVVPNGTAPALKQPYLPGQYTEYPAAVQGWAQQALPGGGSGIESGSSSIVEIVDEEKGTFIIKDWSDYPDDYVPVPDQNKVWTFLEGDEYNSARDSANIFNRNMRAADPYYANNGLEIHEIEPVKMGGSPTDINNKTAIQSQVHRRYVTPWWNKIRDEVKKGLN